MKNVKVILIIFILLFSSIILFNKVSSAYFTYESSVNGSIKTIEDTGGVVTPGGDPEDSYSGLTRNFMSRADITKDHVKTIKFSNVLTKVTSGWTTKVVDVSERYDGKVKMKYTPNKDNDDFYDVEISQNGGVSLNTGNADWMFSRFENLEEINFDKVILNSPLFNNTHSGGVLELTVILSNDIKKFNKQKAFISNKLPDGARIVRKNN